LLCREIIIIVEYTVFGKVENMLIAEEHIIKEIKYEQDVELTVFTPIDSTEIFIRKLTELTNARAIIDLRGQVYVTVDMNGKIINV